MEFPTLFGLPAHPLIVHATVVMVPLASLVVLLHAFVPAARARLGLVTPVLAGVALLLVPLSTQSGEALAESVRSTALVRKHVELGEGLTAWVLLLFVVSVLLVVRDRMTRAEAARVEDGRSAPEAPRRADRVLRVLVGPAVIGTLTVVAVLGTTVQVARIGHSGAEASWSDLGARQ